MYRSRKISFESLELRQMLSGHPLMVGSAGSAVGAEHARHNGDDNGDGPARVSTSSTAHGAAHMDATSLTATLSDPNDADFEGTVRYSSAIKKGETMTRFDVHVEGGPPDTIRRSMLPLTGRSSDKSRPMQKGMES
jgi:hypothetical protein